jgi:hypothetical protein
MQTIKTNPIPLQPIKPAEICSSSVCILSSRFVKPISDAESAPNAVLTTTAAFQQMLGILLLENSMVQAGSYFQLSMPATKC